MKLFGVIISWSSRIGSGRKFGGSGQVTENGLVDVFD